MSPCENGALNPGLPLTALALAALLAPAAPRAWEGDYRLEGSAGTDSNPLRSSTGSSADGFLESVLEAHGRAEGDRGALRASLSEGGRLFFATPDANVLATRAEAEASTPVSDRAMLGALLALHDLSEQGGVRSETGGRAAATGRLEIRGTQLLFAAGFGASYPRATELRLFTSRGPEAGLTFSFGAGPGHAVELGYELRRRIFPRWDGGRADVGQTAYGDWIWRGPVVIGLGYAFTFNSSDVSGGDYHRHRVTLRAATLLPFGWSLALNGSLQRSVYPGGTFTDAPALLAQGDEKQNALELRLSRALGERLEIALKAGAYASELGSAGVRLPYDRQVIQVALGWRLE